MLEAIPAKLKLVIAGNHDRTLDKAWVLRHLRRRYTEEEKEEALRVCEEGNEIMRGELAGKAGVTYLEEGVHEFVLGNGAGLRIYASPFTPEFCGFGWAYEREEDRFNGVSEREVGMKGVRGAVRIPGFEEDRDKDGNGDGGNVDIVMTHGPPMNILDKVDGYAGHVGCVNLFRALSRAKPKLFCCGHIHEGHGAEVVSWEEKDIARRRNVQCCWPGLNREVVVEGKETLMVNASIMDVGYRPVNKPWFVEIGLLRAEGGGGVQG